MLKSSICAHRQQSLSCDEIATHELHQGAVEGVELWVRDLVRRLPQELRIRVQETTNGGSVSFSLRTRTTHRSTSFLRFAPVVPFFTRSILLITLTHGTSSPTIQLIALSTPLKYFAESSMNCDSRRYTLTREMFMLDVSMRARRGRTGMWV